MFFVSLGGAVKVTGTWKNYRPFQFGLLVSNSVYPAGVLGHGGHVSWHSNAKLLSCLVRMQTSHVFISESVKST